MIKINAKKIKSRIDEAIEKYYGASHNAALYTIFFDDKPVICANNKYRKPGVAFLLNNQPHQFETEKAYDVLERAFKRFGNSIFLSQLSKVQNNLLYNIKPYDAEFPAYGTFDNYAYSDLSSSFPIMEFVAAGYAKNINPNLISALGYQFDYDKL
jgi:hypothetical protein